MHRGDLLQALRVSSLRRQAVWPASFGGVVTGRLSGRRPARRSPSPCCPIPSRTARPNRSRRPVFRAGARFRCSRAWRWRRFLRPLQILLENRRRRSFRRLLQLRRCRQTTNCHFRPGGSRRLAAARSGRRLCRSRFRIDLQPSFPRSLPRLAGSAVFSSLLIQRNLRKDSTCFSRRA